MLPLLPLLSVLTVGSTSLEWTAPAACPDQARAQAWVEEALAGREASVDAAVTIESNGDGWVARLETERAPRSLEDPDCEALARAVVVVLTVDAVAAQETVTIPEPRVPTPAEPPRPEPEPTSALEPAPTTPPAPSVTTDAGPPLPPLRHRLGILGGLAWGPIPAAAGAVGMRYRVGRTRWEFGMDALYQPPRTLRYADGVAGGVFQSASASASGCAVLGPERIAIPLCLGAEAGALFGQGVDAFETRGAVEPWLTARLDAGVRGQISERFELALEAQGAAAAVRPAFKIGERDPLTRTPALLARGLVSIYWRLR